MFDKMTEGDLAVRVARNAYRFNKDNPNDFIVECYNYAVATLNQKAPQRTRLLNSRKHLQTALSLIRISHDEEIKALKGNCEAGIKMIDQRLLKK